MINNNRGSALAIVLLSISIMAMMMYVLSQVVIDQQKSINNYEDIKIAENYAKSALLSAESRVYYFDSGKYTLAGINQTDSTTHNIENPTASCCDNGKGSDIYRRYLVMKHYNLITDGSTCNSSNSFKGICYSLIESSITPNSNSYNYSSDPSWQPWIANVSGTVKPCNSYSSSYVPMIDDKTYRYSWRFLTNDSRLCTDPRMIVEPINLAYRGSFKMADSSTESDYIMQSTGAQLITYKENNGNILIFSPRLYRITVVAFGRNGDTKVTLQEIVLINNFTGTTVDTKRVIGDTSSNLSNRIVRLSTRWLN